MLCNWKLLVRKVPLLTGDQAVLFGVNLEQFCQFCHFNGNICRHIADKLATNYCLVTIIKSAKFLKIKIRLVEV